MRARSAVALAAVVAAAAGRADDVPAHVDDAPAHSSEAPASANDAPERADGSVARANAAVVPLIRLALLGEAAFSTAHAEGAVLVAGGRLTLRTGRLALVGSIDRLASGASVQPRFGALVLAGAGLVHDLSPRFGLHWALVGGFSLVEIVDYVDGGWRSVSDLAGGARVGFEWRAFGETSRGQVAFAPVLGVSATVVYAGSESDRLRGIEWGGLTALVSVTLGFELASPPR